MAAPGTCFATEPTFPVSRWLRECRKSKTDMTLETWNITWNRGRASLQSLGGMLAPAEFLLADGRWVQPLAIAPWGDDQGPEYNALPGLLKRLRGEWPCIPFGSSRAGLPAAWEELPNTFRDQAPHGYGSNNHWTLIKRKPDELALAIDYPDNHPIARVTRRIAGVRDFPQLRLGLEVEVRDEIELGLAVHPVFRLPDEPGQAEIVIVGEGGGRTFPLANDVSSQLRCDTRFASIRRAPLSNGEFVDLSRLPLASSNEDLVQVVATGGAVALSNLAEGYVATLSYDSELFPTVVLWIANCGWGAYPWLGRFRALGIEPARAAFDLGQGVSANPSNPWRHQGVATSISLRPGASLRTSYTISVDAL